MVYSFDNFIFKTPLTNIFRCEIGCKIYGITSTTLSCDALVFSLTRIWNDTFSWVWYCNSTYQNRRNQIIFIVGNTRLNNNFSSWNNLKYKISKVFKEKLETTPYARVSSTPICRITYLFYWWKDLVTVNSYFIWNFKNYCKKMNKNSCEKIFYLRAKKRSLRLLFLFRKWCTQLESNQQPTASKTGTLSNWAMGAKYVMVQPAGFEPAASTFAGLRSSNWAMAALMPQ